MSTLSIETCVTALNGAALSRKAAFQIEMAVGMAIFTVEGEANKTARNELCEAYAAAGYQCLSPDEIDYKTVNRRINVTADLFNVISLRTIKKWIGDSNENEMLDAIVEGLKPYELQSVSDAQRFCEPPKPKSINAANDASNKPQTITVTPDTSILQGPTGTGHKAVMSMFRRAADEKDAKQIRTEHVTVVVPKSADREELVELAMRLLSLAEEMKHVAKEEQAA